MILCMASPSFLSSVLPQQHPSTWSMSQEYEAIGVYDDDGEAPEASFEHQSESLPFDDKRALRNVLVNGASFTVLSMCLSPSLVRCH